MSNSNFSISLAMPLGHWSPLLIASLASVELQSKKCYLSILDASGDDRVQENIIKSGIKTTYLRKGIDAGQTAAITEGWASVGGEIVGWLNGDDMLMPGAIDFVIKHFEQNPDTDVLCGQSTISDIKGRILGLHPDVAPVDTMIYRSNIISQPSCFIRRRAIDAIGGLNNDLEYTMDWDLWVRLLMDEKKFVYTDHILSNVTWEHGTKTSQFSWPRIFELYTLLRRYNNIYVTAKSLFGFFQHYIGTYKKPFAAQMEINTIHTPITEGLSIPAINVTTKIQNRICIKIRGRNSRKISVSVQGVAYKFIDNELVIKLSKPVKTGQCVNLAFKNPAQYKVSFESFIWC